MKKSVKILALLMFLNIGCSWAQNYVIRFHDGSTPLTVANATLYYPSGQPVATLNNGGVFWNGTTLVGNILNNGIVTNYFGFEIGRLVSEGWNQAPPRTQPAPGGASNKIDPDEVWLTRR